MSGSAWLLFVRPAAGLELPVHRQGAGQAELRRRIGEAAAVGNHGGELQDPPMEDLPVGSGGLGAESKPQVSGAANVGRPGKPRGMRGRFRGLGRPPGVAALQRDGAAHRGWKDGGEDGVGGIAAQKIAEGCLGRGGHTRKGQGERAGCGGAPPVAEPERRQRVGAGFRFQPEDRFVEGHRGGEGRRAAEFPLGGLAGNGASLRELPAESRRLGLEQQDAVLEGLAARGLGLAADGGEVAFHRRQDEARAEAGFPCPGAPAKGRGHLRRALPARAGLLLQGLQHDSLQIPRQGRVERARRRRSLVQPGGRSLPAKGPASRRHVMQDDKPHNYIEMPRHAGFF